MAGNNPISYEDLFNFSDDSEIKAAIKNINALKKAYQGFFETIITSQLDKLAEQENALLAANLKLAESTKQLSISQKEHQKTLDANLKSAEANRVAAEKLRVAQDNVKKANETVGTGVKTLAQQFSELKKQYEQALAAGDTKKMAEVAAQAQAVDKQIKAVNQTLRSTKEQFQAAAGSYDALNQRTKELIAQVKAMPGGFDNTSKAANALKKEIYDNTQKLKDFDKQLNQNFRNVGNYKSAFEGLGNSITSLLSGYLTIYAAIGLVNKIVDNNSKLSDSIADVRRTAGLTANEADRLVSSLKKLDTRTSLEGLLQISIIGGRLGIAKDNLVGFTDAANKLTQALGSELGNTEEITTGLGKIINIFSPDKNITGDALLKVGNAIVDLANKGVASGKYIVDFTQRLAGIAGVAKISLGSTIGLGAGLEELGQSAEVGGTAVTQILFKIGQDVPKYAKLAGRSTQEFAETLKKAPIEALIQLSEGLAKNKAGFAEISESFKDAEAKGVRVAGTLAVIGQNSEFLRGKINDATDALQKTNEITDAANLKNQTLAGSIDKLKNSFVNATTSGAIGNFFKEIVDGLDDAIHYFESLANSKSFKEVTDRFLVTTQSRKKQVNDIYSISDKIDNTQPLISQFNKQNNPLGSSNSIVASALADTPIKDLKAMIEKYAQAARDAADAYNTYYKGVASGELKDGGKYSVEDARNNFSKLQGILNTLSSAYIQAKDKVAKNNPIKQASDDAKKDTPAVLDSIAAIRKEIKRLSELPGSADKNSDVFKQIKALKDRLKELNGGAKTTAKDGFAVLQDKIDSLEKQLQDSIIGGKVKATDYNNPLVVKLNAAKKALSDYKATLDKVLQGPAPGLSIGGSPNDINTIAPQLSGQQRRIDNNNKSNDALTSLDDVALKYAQINKDIEASYQARNINIDQYNADLLKSEIDQKNEEYFLNKVSLQAQLDNAKDGSREQKRLLKDIADLDARHSRDQIKNAQDVEAARIKSIQDVFSELKQNLQPLQEQLGSGFANVFSLLTSDLEKFFEKGKEGFGDFKDKFEAVAAVAGAIGGALTESFNSASEARITQLEKEKDQAVKAAGNNVAAQQAITDQYDQRIAQQKRKQAAADKANALFQIAINTAVAVVKALPNIPLSIAVGALGAVELALVAAKPLPKFFKGTDDAPGGEAWVGEKGRELMFLPDGKVEVTKPTAERRNVPKHTVIKTAEETQAIFDYFRLKDNQFAASYLNSMVEPASYVSNSSLSDAQILAYINSNKLTEDQIARAMGRAVKNMPVQNFSLDEYGFNKYQNKQRMRASEQRRRLKIGGRG